MSLMYRDKHMSCPRCQGTLNQRGSVDQCPACSGAFVGTAVLEAMVQNMTGASSKARVEVEPAAEPTDKRSCPACEKLLSPVLFASVTIDQCGDHGYWFDAEELQAALEKIGHDKPKPKSVSLWRAVVGWLMAHETTPAEDLLRILDGDHLTHEGWDPWIPE